MGIVAVRMCGHAGLRGPLPNTQVWTWTDMARHGHSAPSSRGSPALCLMAGAQTVTRLLLHRLPRVTGPCGRRRVRVCFCVSVCLCAPRLRVCDGARGIPSVSASPSINSSINSFTQPAPRGATKQIQPTPSRRRPSPSHQGGRVWSTVLGGIRGSIPQRSVRAPITAAAHTPALPAAAPTRGGAGRRANDAGRGRTTRVVWAVLVTREEPEVTLQ